MGHVSSPTRSPCDSCSSTAPELTRLMVRYDVGVAVRKTYQLKSVDDDFFDDSE